jgi:hypothetical protein
MSQAGNETIQLLLEFFCQSHWGLLNENLYKFSMQKLWQLKQNVQPCISSITAASVNEAASNMRKRMNPFIAECGGHIQHLV